MKKARFCNRACFIMQLFAPIRISDSCNSASFSHCACNRPGFGNVSGVGRTENGAPFSPITPTTFDCPVCFHPFPRVRLLVTLDFHPALRIERNIKFCGLPLWVNGAENQTPGGKPSAGIVGVEPTFSGSKPDVLPLN